MYVCVEASHVQLLTTFLSLSCLYLYSIYSSFIFSQKKLNSPVAPLASAVRAGKERLSVVNVVRGEVKRGREGGRGTHTLIIKYTLEAWNYRERKNAL